MPGQHETGCRRNRAEAGDRARDDAEHRRFSAGRPFQEHPGCRPGGGGELRRGHGESGARVGAQSGAAIETEPSHPQEPGPDHRERKVVRRKILRAIAMALADHVGGHKAGHAGIEMHHGAAGEIEYACFGEESTAPDPVRDRHIDENEPAAGKPEKG